MPQITNQSDQLRISIELLGRSQSDPGWFTALIREEYQPQKRNQFHTLVDAAVEIYEGDILRLRERFAAFLSTGDESANFKFVPVAEPSFELGLERIPHGTDYCRVVSLGLDLKMLVQMSTPAGYGENRIIVRFHTTEDRIQRFGRELLKATEKTAPLPSGTSSQKTPEG